MALTDFHAARQHLEDDGRIWHDKRMSIAEAAEHVRDGDHVAIGGCLYSRTPMAMLFELVRHHRRGLTMSRSLTCYEAELLPVAGVVEGIVTSWVGLGSRWGSAKVFRELVESGKLSYEEWSHLGIGLRFHAGAMGVSFLPTLSMLGSDLVAATGAQTMTCPYTGRELLAIPALFPDVALVHAHRADPYGNVQIDGYSHMDVDIARAARKVIVTAEEIVEPEEIHARADRTVLPHFVVDAVVEVPFGAFPNECWGRYDADFEHIDEYAARARAGGADGVRRYVDDYVHAVGSFEEFLRLFPPSRFDEAARSAREVVG